MVVLETRPTDGINYIEYSMVPKKRYSLGRNTTTQRRSLVSDVFCS